MKNKIVLVALMASFLTGCVTVDTRAIDRFFGNETLTSDQFCEMKRNDLQGTKKLYEGKTMTPTGKITVIEKQGSSHVVGLKVVNDTVYAKVNNLKGNKVGNVVTVSGKVSSANFKDAKKCFFLLDDAVIQ